jgi:hypothetical protein
MARIFTANRYASVVSTMALVIALGGGTAYAATLITSKDIKNGGVKRVDIHKRAINSAKVADGTLLKGDFKAGQLPAGPKGDTGLKGDTGAAGTAVAYALVTSTGAVDSLRSKNITDANIQKGTNPGNYCLRDLPFTPRSAMVAAQGVFDGGQQDVIASAFLASTTVSTTGCSGKALVRTFDISDAALADRAFMIWFEE